MQTTNRILGIFDNCGQTIDRYTIVLDKEYNPELYREDVLTSLALSDNPEHPQGFSQFGACHIGPHLGRQITLEDLPPHIVEHIKRRLEE